MENKYKKFPLSIWRGARGEGKPKRKIISDVIFWVIVIMLVIPSTRSIILGGVSKVRTAVFAPALKASDGPVLSDGDLSWRLENLDGESITLASLKGEFILVNVWATWCPPCRAEMPSLEKLYKNYGDRISFVMVSNEEVDVVRAFIEKKGYTFPVYLAKSGSPEALTSKSIPATFLISKTGQLIYQKAGAFDWNSNKVHKFIENHL